MNRVEEALSHQMELKRNLKPLGGRWLCFREMGECLLLLISAEARQYFHVLRFTITERGWQKKNPSAWNVSVNWEKSNNT
jgi:hypothetical protein